MIKGVENVLKRSILTALSVFSFLIVGCGDLYYYSLELELDPRLNQDGNGFYHLNINDGSWQTLHRLSGHVVDSRGDKISDVKVFWESTHVWFLGDTLGYAVTYGYNDDLTLVGVDTSYVTGFENSVVPTINCCSYSNGDGEINTMFAPVQSMRGDTVGVWVYFYDEWSDFEPKDYFFNIILE